MDAIEDVTVGEQQLKSRYFGIIRQSKKNFWSQLVNLGMRYGTLCDRDYEIKRTGSTLDTTYSIIPLEVDPELRDIDVLHEFYGYGKEVKQDDPNRLLYCPQTLPEWAEYYAGEERVKYFLVDSAESAAPEASTPSQQSGFASTASDEPQSAYEASVPDNTEFGASLRDLLLRNK